MTLISVGFLQVHSSSNQNPDMHLPVFWVHRHNPSSLYKEISLTRVGYFSLALSVS